jgi:hypothetical protein
MTFQTQLVVNDPETRQHCAVMFGEEGEIQAVNINWAVAAATSVPKMSLVEFGEYFGSQAAASLSSALQPRNSKPVTLRHMSVEDLRQYLAEKKKKPAKTVARQPAHH